MTSTLKCLCVAGLIGVAALATGCNNDIKAKDVRSDYSPELFSMGMSKEQMKNAHARTIDTNGRQAWDDAARLLLLDRPLRTSKYPIP